MKKLMVVAGVKLALLASPPAAMGQEVDAITFEVPVQLENLMPNIERVRVACGVYPSASQISASDRIGIETSANEVSADGSYSGTLQVRIRADAADLHKFSSAKHYVCTIFLIGTASEGRPGPDKPDAWLQPKTGTTFVGLVDGTIP